MTNEEILSEFSALPPEAQRLVADFIAFLRQRYGALQDVVQPKTLDLSAEPFIGMWKDREDMKDSVAWVRNLREQEWGKHRGDHHRGQRHSD